MTSLGIVLVTHVTEVSEGLVKLLREVAKDVGQLIRLILTNRLFCSYLWCIIVI